MRMRAVLIAIGIDADRKHHVQEWNWRTRVVRIVPNEAACLRLIRALAAETTGQWVSAHTYLSGQIGLVGQEQQQPVDRKEAA